MASATIALNTGHVDRKINITGSGFTANATVTIKYNNVILGTTSADGSGNISVTALTIKDFEGTYDLVCTDGTNVSRTSYAVSLQSTQRQ